MENIQSQTGQLSFLDLARDVIQGEQRALTIDEIWEIADSRGLVQRLGSSGKTPKATLGARLYTQAKMPDGMFKRVGSRPAQFILRSILQENPHLAEPISPPAPPVRSSNKYRERDLHPVMVWFAAQRFGTSCRTIYHEKSVKKGQKHNEWLHPDIVGFSLTTQGWEEPVVSLAKQCGSVAAKLYSFELKIDVNFSTLRQYFFQAVSNSSWAHEGYLVAVDISDDPEFREELTRLSQSFGIGVIRLDLEQPLNSEVMLPASEREEVDWETINRIAVANEDFSEFIKFVVKSAEINQVVTVSFDKVLTDEQIGDYTTKLLSRAAVQHSADDGGIPVTP